MSMTTNKQTLREAKEIIASINIKHGSGDIYAPIIRWDEFQAITGELDKWQQESSTWKSVAEKQLAIAIEAEKRIAELSASHSKLRETMAAIHNTIKQDGFATPLAVIMQNAKRAHEESVDAAGITVKGE